MAPRATTWLRCVIGSEAPSSPKGETILMRRKLMLPALAACALLAVSAPVTTAKPPTARAAFISLKGVLGIVTKALKPIQDINSGQTAAIHRVDTRVDTVVAGLKTINETAVSLAAAFTASLTQLVQFTTLPAGTANPNTAGVKTASTSSVPAVLLSTLSPGTVYRQLVTLPDSATWPVPFDAAQAATVTALTAGGFPTTLPLGARTWVKMPDVNNAALGGDFYKNTWACTSGGVSAPAKALLVSKLTGSFGAAGAATVANAIPACP